MKTAQQTEFGDFQTPDDLARRCCRLIRDQLGCFETIIEPTCGKGAFVAAADDVLSPQQIRGYEIQPEYVQIARERLVGDQARHEIRCQDFFTTNWQAERAGLGDSVLFLGNPPWVTNSTLGAIGSSNVPHKSNLQRTRGIDALTGSSNFDISESVLRTLLSIARTDSDAVAMLIKTATARKVLRSAWADGMQFSHISSHEIDSKSHFKANVDACLLVMRSTSVASKTPQICLRYSSLEATEGDIAFGWQNRRLVSDPEQATATEHLRAAQGEETPWRSGIKHDAARVLELIQEGRGLKNRDGVDVDIEPDHIFPFAKGSDVANRKAPSRRLLVPQHSLNEATETRLAAAPKTLRYLHTHREVFASRKSSIYRNRDPFAVFGIGDYTFAPWKVAICGLYKRLTFEVFGPVDGRPVVFDDTTYALSFPNEEEALQAKQLLESEPASRFFNSRAFWDAKRPITAELLRSLDLSAVEPNQESI